MEWGHYFLDIQYITLIFFHKNNKTAPAGSLEPLSAVTQRIRESTRERKHLPWVAKFDSFQVFFTSCQKSLVHSYCMA